MIEERGEHLKGLPIKIEKVCFIRQSFISTQKQRLIGFSRKQRNHLQILASNKRQPLIKKQVFCEEMQLPHS